MVSKWLQKIYNSNSIIVKEISKEDIETQLILIPRYLHPNLIDTYFSDILNEKNINHINIIRNNIDLILNYYTNLCMFLITYIKITGDKKIILDYFNEILEKSNDYNELILIKNTLYYYKDFELFIKNKYTFLYKLIENIDEKNKWIIFKKFCIPIINNNKYDELQKIYEILCENNLNNYQIKYIGMNIENYLFKLDKYKIILSTYKGKYEIYDHYRINPSLIRKKININDTSNIYIEINPLEENIKVSEKDIYDALDDLNDSNIIVTNSNYDKIFKVVNNEIPNNFKRSVDGIIETRNKDYSSSYRNKKVKLINKDYIYDKNCKDFVYIKKLY